MQSFIPNYDLRTENKQRTHGRARGHTGAQTGSTPSTENRTIGQQIHIASFLALSVDCSRLHSVFPRTLSISSVLRFSMWRTDPRDLSHNTKDTVFLCVSDDIA